MSQQCELYAASLFPVHCWLSGSGDGDSATLFTQVTTREASDGGTAHWRCANANANKGTEDSSAE